ncbi:hypothetical protein WJU16_20310 [Chitinophaga pollutisoli]|uniref:Uncharacterized protein n=1 Tax=Chitinophaga pollutisoli TaxID=3133966 RepID=A0ABZ2YL72_9BACT
MQTAVEKERTTASREGILPAGRYPATGASAIKRRVEWLDERSLRNNDLK